MPVTLKELAERAKVHPSTVSRVVNHDPRLRIAPATRSTTRRSIACWEKRRGDLRVPSAELGAARV